LDWVGVESGGGSLCSDPLSFIIVPDNHNVKVVTIPKVVDKRLALVSVHLADWK